MALILEATRLPSALTDFDRFPTTRDEVSLYVEENGRFVLQRLQLFTTFYIDTTTGDDENTGLLGSPLRTWAEIERRLRGRVYRQNMRIVVNGLLAEDMLISWTAINGKKIAVVGTPTLIRQGVISAKTDINVATAQDGTVTDAALGTGAHPASWGAAGAVDAAAARGALLIRKMNGESTVAAAFTMKDLGSKTCRVSQFVSTTEDPFQSVATQLETTVAINDSYRVDALTQVGDVIVAVPGTDVILQWLDLRAQDSAPLKLSCAGSARITLRMTSLGSSSLVEGAAAIVGFVACAQIGSDGYMLAEGNGFGWFLRGQAGANPSPSFRIFGAAGLGFPGNLCLQSCGLFGDNGTAIGFSSILACDLTGIPALKLATNSRAKFVTIAAPAGGACSDVGVETGAGCVAVLSGGVAGSFTTGAARVCGTIIPNAKLGVASFDYTHMSGVILDNGLGTVAVGPAGSSTTAARPTVGLAKGMQWFDETLNKPIWRNAANNAWVDAVGNVV